jgi:hypothetical protein
MDTLLCNDDGDIVIGTYDPSNTLLRLSADQYTAGSATWTDQSGNGLDFTVSTNASLKGTDADGFPYMNFSGSYGYAQRLVGGVLTNIPAPTTGKYTIFCVTQILNSTSNYRTLTRGATADHQILIHTGNNNLGLYDNNGSSWLDSGFDVTTAMTSSRNLLTWELSTSSPIYKFQLNESGTNSTITSATNYTLPFASLGGVSTQYWGNIYEFIVYDGVLSASVRDYVAEYLAYKWDISSKLPSLTSTHGVTTLESIGALDDLGVSLYNTAVGAYALRRLFGLYPGPQVRLRRSTDNAETDVYFSSDGSTQNLNLTTWLGGGTAYVKTWYDQSGNGNNVTQATAGSQPILTAPSGEAAYIRFQSKIMTGPNVFGSSSVTNMHMISTIRDNVRSNNYFISLNGTNTGNPGRFFIHGPYGNGTWYWDPGSVTTDRANTGSNATALGAKTVFSGYKSSADGKNGFRLNGGTRFLSSGTTSAGVTGGIRIGEGATDHSIYDLIIFSSKLSDANESYIESVVA